MIYYYSYKTFVMNSDPGNQFHWNEMYFQQISYGKVLSSCIVVVVYINWFLFVNPMNIQKYITKIKIKATKYIVPTKKK